MSETRYLHMLVPATNCLISTTFLRSEGKQSASNLGCQLGTNSGDQHRLDYTVSGFTLFHQPYDEWQGVIKDWTQSACTVDDFSPSDFPKIAKVFVQYDHKISGFNTTRTWCVQVLRSPKEAFAAAMQSWRERCEKYVCLQGDHVEKRLHFQLPVVSSFL